MYLSFLLQQLDYLCEIFALESSWWEFKVKNMYVELDEKWTIMSLES
jgi:hypothetical protein